LASWDEGSFLSLLNLNDQPNRRRSVHSGRRLFLLTMKINQRLFLSVFVVCALFIGCSKPVFHHRPSDKACIAWLDGQKIILNKGLVLDEHWLIHASAFTSFNIVSITPASDGSMTAAVQFELMGEVRGLRVEGQIVYRHHKKDDVIEFISFMPTRIVRLGKW
jgi:hypothetical protein